MYYWNVSYRLKVWQNIKISATIAGVLMLVSLACQGQCKELRKKDDKFEKKTTISTPILKSMQFEPVSFTRIDEGGQSSVYLRLTANSGLSTKKKGIIMLFTDGSRLEWPDEEVDFDYYKEYYCNCFIRLNQAEIDKIKTNNITDFKLYVHEKSLNKSQSERVKQLMNCIVDADPSSIKEGKF